MGPADSIYMTSIEITAAFGSILVVLAALFYALHRQCGTIRQQEHAIGMYRQALDDERKAHAKTQEQHRNEILCSSHWLNRSIAEQEAHESTKRDLLAERSELGTDARNVDARTK